MTALVIFISFLFSTNILHADASLSSYLRMLSLPGTIPAKMAFDDTQPNMVPVTIRFTSSPGMERITELEHDGVVFSRFNGQIINSSNIYPCRIPISLLSTLAESSDIARIEHSFNPTTAPTLNVSAPQVQAADTWTYKYNNEYVMGQGQTIIDIDTGIDIYHPGFFKPSDIKYAWIDVNGNTEFDPGIDCVDLDNDGVGSQSETLSYFDALFRDPENLMDRTGGIYDADIDWLYNDANNSNNREYGPTYGYGENDPCFGEVIFIITDLNGNNRLDPGEPLTPLGESRIRAVIDKDGVHQRGIDLFENTGDIINHGTGACGIAGGQTPGRRLTGMAPGVEFIAVNQTEVDVVDGVETALNLNGLDKDNTICMYEYASWVFEFLDGSSNVEQVISDLHSSGIPQCTATGNLAGPARKKHALLTIEPQSKESLNFSVPESSNISIVYFSLLWRDNIIPQIEISDGTASYTLIISMNRGYDDNIGNYQIVYGSETSDRGTKKIDVILSSDDTISGDFSINITNINRRSSVTVDGYITDDKTSWMYGTQFTNFITDDGTVCTPATADNSITVGAYDPRGTRNELGEINDFSSWGARIDGVNVIDICAPGTLVYSLTSHQSAGGQPGGYIDFGGTSSALPHVAGCIALIKQVIPGIQPDMINSFLRSYALTDTYTGSVPNTIWGYGKLRIRDIILDTGSIVDVESEAQPSPISVSSPFPNPFNATVSFNISTSIPDKPITVNVFNVLGQQVYESRIQYTSQSPYRFYWNGVTNDGDNASTGLYLFSFISAGHRINKHVMLIR